MTTRPLLISAMSVALAILGLGCGGECDDAGDCADGQICGHSHDGGGTCLDPCDYDATTGEFSCEDGSECKMGYSSCSTCDDILSYCGS